LRALNEARSTRGQGGRTLIELMISLAIGLAITAAVSGAYLSTTRTSRVAGEMAGIADTGQLSMLMIGDSIRQAGYGEIIGSDVSFGAANVDAYRSQTLFGDGAHIAGCTGALFVDDTTRTPTCAPAANPNFDTLMLRFQGDTAVAPAQGRIDDCLGAQVPLEALPANHLGLMRVASRPMIQNVYFGTNNGLSCRGNGRAAIGDAFAPAQQLVGNVEQFKVFYGFDDVRFANPNSTLGASIRSIRDASYLNGIAGSWDYVVTVHVCMLIRSDPDSGNGLTTTSGYTYTGCPMSAAQASGSMPSVTATDTAVRRTYNQVFTVRSRSTANPVQSF
ncbi:MAG: PilW family protein, partial [Burkholderiales bacterium]